MRYFEFIKLSCENSKAREREVDEGESERAADIIRFMTRAAPEPRLTTAI